MPVISEENSRGTNFEKEVIRYLENYFDHEPWSFVVYGPFTFRAPNQGSIEVDGLVISPYGIFTIESKNYPGRIERGQNTPLKVTGSDGRKTQILGENDPFDQASKQAKSLKSYFVSLGARDVVVKSLLVFPKGNTFNVPPQDRDIGDISNPFIGSLDEIPGEILAFKPTRGPYLTEQDQKVLLKAIHEGAHRLSQTERNLLSSIQSKNPDHPDVKKQVEPKRKYTETTQSDGRYTIRSIARISLFILLLYFFANLGLTQPWFLRTELGAMVADVFMEHPEFILPLRMNLQDSPTEGSSPSPNVSNSSSRDSLRVEGCFTASTLNVREGPGTDYRIVGYLEKGDCVIFSGRNQKGTWGLTRTGWVSLHYFQIDGDVMDLPVTKP